jgi:acetylglutamate kinase
MKILIKLGGTLLDEPGTRERLANGIAAVGLPLAVVHGGGKQLTRFLAERGIESRFINGLRVTTPDVIDAVLKVFAGSVNHQLVASLIKAGANPVGITGIDACLIEAEQWSPELGSVGKPVKTNPRLLEVLTSNGFLPVVACVAGDRQGNIYNVNADQLAAACAAGFGVEMLLFLTDVTGVLDSNKAIVPLLTKSESAKLIAAGIATGGMQAKLEAAHHALDGGVAQVVIAPGAEPNVIARILGGESLGTRLIH